jgi:signal transduction histidine kinase
MVVLDERRHILYGNRLFQDALGKDFILHCNPPRPGEILGCRRAWDTSFGCGGGEACRYCGAGQAFFTSLREDRQITRECAIDISGEEDFSEVEYRVTASPLWVEGHRFLLVTLEDISGEKYRERMERTFFHDIMNSAGVIQGVVEILEDAESLEDLRGTLPIMKQGTTLLMEEIEAQRSLFSAEKGTLRAEPVPLKGESFIWKVAEEMSSFPDISRNKEIVVVPPRDPCLARGDELLFRRVLLNMMKNALEATPPGGLVTAGCQREENPKGDRILFWVHNRGVLSEEVRYRIFRRSFSTKGEGRGIGTYSMKLFLVQYLKGDVWFVSDEKRGTFFYAALPAWGAEDHYEGRKKA